MLSIRCLGFVIILLSGAACEAIRAEYKAGIVSLDLASFMWVLLSISLGVGIYVVELAR